MYNTSPTLDFAHHIGGNGINVFAGKQIGDLATGQQIIHVDQKSFVDDLAVQEQKQDSFVFQARPPKHRHQINFEIVQAVTG